MQTSWPFFVVALALALAAAAAIVRPLLRAGAGAERRASYDLRIYRDQLREIERDLARGAIGADEAAAVRVEVSRRLLSAADAEAAEAAAARAPGRISRGAALGVTLALVLVAGGLYAWLGRPGRPDAPLLARLEALAAARAGRPGQAEAEAIVAQRPDAAPRAQPAGPDLELIEKLRAAVAARPDDVEGQRLLGRTELSLGDWAAARAARQRVVELLGPAATASDRLDLAEAMILAAGGYVSPEAEAELTATLRLDPSDPSARYYSGLALLQGGRADLTYAIWSRLLAEGPADAPWIAAIEAQMAEVAARAGRPAPDPAPMSPSDQAQMIEGMVAGLADRLAAEGGPPEDWAQLIRSLGVLGRPEEAGEIWREAREVFAADPAALALLDETARAAGVAR